MIFKMFVCLSMYLLQLQFSVLDFGKLPLTYKACFITIVLLITKYISLKCLFRQIIAITVILYNCFTELFEFLGFSLCDDRKNSRLHNDKNTTISRIRIEVYAKNCTCLARLLILYLNTV